jgi:hypothetical protein
MIGAPVARLRKELWVFLLRYSIQLTAGKPIP